MRQPCKGHRADSLSSEFHFGYATGQDANVFHRIDYCRASRHSGGLGHNNCPGAEGPEQQPAATSFAFSRQACGLDSYGNIAEYKSDKRKSDPAGFAASENYGYGLFHSGFNERQ